MLSTIGTDSLLIRKNKHFPVSKPSAQGPSRPIVLGWPKSSFWFFCKLFGKTRTNCLANPIHSLCNRVVGAPQGMGEQKRNGRSSRAHSLVTASIIPSWGPGTTLPSPRELGSCLSLPIHVSRAPGENTGEQPIAGTPPDKCPKRESQSPWQWWAADEGGLPCG